jgi:hypothetical protein
MRPLLHLINVLLVLPVVALAAAFAVFGHAISTRSWAGFFGVLLDTFVWLLPWGLLILFVSLVLLVLGGLTARFRGLASLCVAILAVGGTAVALTTVAGHDNFSPDQLVFFAPSLVSASIGLWLAVGDRSRSSNGVA